MSGAARSWTCSPNWRTQQKRSGGPRGRRGAADDDRSGDVGRGFLALDPYHRVVFTWGMEDGAMAIPPGASTVEVTLTPDGDGTLLTLVHRDLPPEACAPHFEGWTHYLGRLVVRAESRDPGPDAWLEPSGA
ncbi:SRPBCC domain-containing protein [Kitasatospora sp. NPDC090091]|uniref:SRPBCC family protein n=1 Tax=Kitasatospora sp. NPDC090091 TaxID=3364081 RepID=UPI0038288DD3